MLGSEVVSEGLWPSQSDLYLLIEGTETRNWTTWPCPQEAAGERRGERGVKVGQKEYRLTKLYSHKGNTVEPLK